MRFNRQGVNEPKSGKIVIFAQVKPIKTILSITVLSFYMLGSVGIVFYSHSCMGNVKSTTAFSSESKCCCSEMMKDRMSGCCDDEVHLVKLSEDQNYNEFSPKFTNDWVSIVPQYFEIADTISEEGEDYLWVYDLPPPPPPDIRILSCSLTYYG